MSLFPSSLLSGVDWSLVLHAADGLTDIQLKDEKTIDALLSIIQIAGRDAGVDGPAGVSPLAFLEKLSWAGFEKCTRAAPDVNPSVKAWPLTTEGFAALETQASPPKHDVEWLLAAVVAAGFSPWTSSQGKSSVYFYGCLLQGRVRLVIQSLALPDAPPVADLLSVRRDNYRPDDVVLRDEPRNETWAGWLLRRREAIPVCRAIAIGGGIQPSVDQLALACPEAAWLFQDLFKDDADAQKVLREAWATRTDLSVKDLCLLHGLWRLDGPEELRRERVRMTVQHELEGRPHPQVLEESEAGEYNEEDERNDGLGWDFWRERSEAILGGESCEWSVLASRLVGRLKGWCPYRGMVGLPALWDSRECGVDRVFFRELEKSFPGVGPSGMPWEGLFALNYLETAEKALGLGAAERWATAQFQSALDWTRWLLRAGVAAPSLARLWMGWVWCCPKTMKENPALTRQLLDCLRSSQVFEWDDDNNSGGRMMPKFYWNQKETSFLRLVCAVCERWGNDQETANIPPVFEELEGEELWLALDVAWTVGHPDWWNAVTAFAAQGGLSIDQVDHALERSAEIRLRASSGRELVTAADLEGVRAVLRNLRLAHELPSAPVSDRRERF